MNNLTQTLPNKGIYLLEIFAKEKFTVDINKFSGITFPKGYYYYVGSAQKNFRSRIERHLRKTKTIHWHIDHLTANPLLTIKNLYVIPNAKRSLEWQIANDLLKIFDCEIIVKGFGNSDTNKTVTHLLYRKKRIYYNHFISVYQSIVRLRPSSIEIS